MAALQLELMALIRLREMVNDPRLINLTEYRIRELKDQMK